MLDIDETEDPEIQENLTLDQIDDRIHFLENLQVMEIDYSNLHMDCTKEVNTFYDRVEERISETGEDLWFFLVNYSGSRIDPGAWFAFSRRGKILNKAHSMGSVRFDASEETRRQIARSAGTENFDANLFADRDEAIERLKTLPCKRLGKAVHVPNYSLADFEPRVTFHDADQIMEIDLSGLRLQHSRDVNDLMNFLQGEIVDSGRRWFFLANYNDCHIAPAAWVQWAKRGKELNVGGSLGTVRFEAGAETEADIRLRAQTMGFRPNIRNTREEALARIAELKAAT